MNQNNNFETGVNKLFYISRENPRDIGIKLKHIIKVITQLAFITNPIHLNKNTLKVIDSILKDILSFKGLNVKEFELIKAAELALEEISLFKSISFTTRSNMEIAIASYYKLNQKLNYNKLNLLYPRNIHIETIALCNAKCTFCDYKELKRTGTKMSDDMINKILTELSLIPKNLEFTVSPYKISEPFLDKRLIPICEQILKMHPLSRISLISNGNFIPDKAIEELIELSKNQNFYFLNKNKNLQPRMSISFSLNECESEEYEELMKLDFKRTCNNLNKIHEHIFKSNFPHIIKITRVSTNPSGDIKFLEFCKRKYPLFQPILLKLNDWTGSNEFSHKLVGQEAIPLNAYKELSCLRWFDLSIMADGNIALCCMDSGINHLNIGNALKESIFSIYRRKMKEYLPLNYQRGSSKDPCRGCTYSQGSKLKFTIK